MLGVKIERDEQLELLGKEGTNVHEGVLPPYFTDDLGKA